MTAEEPQLTADQASARDFVRKFYAAGGTPSWTEWMGWSEEIRGYAIDAANDLALDEARSTAGAVGVVLGADPEKIAMMLGDDSLTATIAMTAEAKTINARMARS